LILIHRKKIHLLWKKIPIIQIRTTPLITGIVSHHLFYSWFHDLGYYAAEPPNNRRRSRLILAGAAAGVVGAPVLLPTTLAMIGFSSLGPIAGSIAAGWQAGIGNVAAGSLFSVLQSAGMGGFGTGIITAVASAIGGALGAAAGAIANFFTSFFEDDD
jgi:hypothetical protein